LELDAVENLRARGFGSKAKNPSAHGGRAIPGRDLLPFKNRSSQRTRLISMVNARCSMINRFELSGEKDDDRHAGSLDDLPINCK
jgi:hypothetical protein